MSFDPILLRRILEGALLASGEALSLDRLQSLFDEHERPERKEIVEALQSVQEHHAQQGFALVEVASGWRFQVCPDLAGWVNRLWEEKPQKYSRALLETLALIAYRQPITRSDIEEVRGVAVSSHIIKTLAEREWIKVVGHRDVPGRPSLYATTRQFLDYFGLKSLDELPTLNELKDIDGLNQDLHLGENSDEDSPSSADANAAEARATDEGEESAEAAGAQPGGVSEEPGGGDHRDARTDEPPTHPEAQSMATKDESKQDPPGTEEAAADADLVAQKAQHIASLPIKDDQVPGYDEEADQVLEMDPNESVAADVGVQSAVEDESELDEEADWEAARYSHGPGEEDYADVDDEFYDGNASDSVTEDRENQGDQGSLRSSDE